MPAPGRLRTGVALPALFALTAILIFAGLGTWQLERKSWKESLIATLERRLTAKAVQLPARERWADLDAIHDEFRRVQFSAELIPAQEALVYGGASALRPDVSGPGYWVFAPARLADGAVVVVNRGFVPLALRDPKSRSAAELAGTLHMVGAMRWPQARPLFAAKDDAAGNLWFVRDHRLIAAAKGWGEVAPFYVELESSQGAGEWPRAGALRANLRNDHLQYALTWYALAVVVVVMFGAWLRARRRPGIAAPSL